MDIDKDIDEDIDMEVDRNEKQPESQLCPLKDVNDNIAMETGGTKTL